MPYDLFDRFKDFSDQEGAGFAIRVLVSIAILLLTLIVRRLIKSVVPRIVNSLTTWTRSQWNDRIAQVLIAPMRFLVLVGGLGLVLLALDLPTDISSPVKAVLNALIAVGIVWGIFRLVDPLVEIGWSVANQTVRVSSPDAVESRLTDILAQVLKGVVIILGVAMVFESWGYDVAGLIAGLGIAGLAVALAAQNTLENLIGYFVIVSDEPLRINEYVVFDGVAGIVEHIGFRSTRIRVLDQSLITVPNKTIMNTNVTNWSRLSYRWLNTILGIEYRSSPKQILTVVQAIREMLREHELTQADSVLVQFVAFGDNSLELLIRSFVNVSDYNDFQAALQDLNLRIMNILAEHDVSVAFPSRSVYLEDVRSEANKAAQFVPQPASETSPENDSKPAADAPDEAHE